MQSVKIMKKFIYLLLILITFTSCSEYLKVLKSDDASSKYKFGEQLFNEGKYDKAFKLFREILPKYRGKPEAERLRYLYAKSTYQIGDYPLLTNSVRQFSELYPKSDNRAELQFLSVKGRYFDSPKSSKEQEPTVIAIREIQRFINQNPDSKYTEEANKLVQELDFRLETKAFNIAEQYNITARVSDDFIAAITSFNNFLLDYPGSKLKEDAMFIRLNSAYKLAINSITRKKEQRLKDGTTYYNALKKAFPESKYMEQATKMNETLNQQLQELKTKS